MTPTPPPPPLARRIAIITGHYVPALHLAVAVAVILVTATAAVPGMPWTIDAEFTAIFDMPLFVFVGAAVAGIVLGVAASAHDRDLCDRCARVPTDPEWLAGRRRWLLAVGHMYTGGLRPGDGAPAGQRRLLRRSRITTIAVIAVLSVGLTVPGVIGSMMLTGVMLWVCAGAGGQLAHRGVSPWCQWCTRYHREVGDVTDAAIETLAPMVLPRLVEYTGALGDRDRVIVGCVTCELSDPPWWRSGHVATATRDVEAGFQWAVRHAHVWHDDPAGIEMTVLRYRRA